MSNLNVGSTPSIPSTSSQIKVNKSPIPVQKLDIKSIPQPELFKSSPSPTSTISTSTVNPLQESGDMHRSIQNLASVDLASKASEIKLMVIEPEKGFTKFISGLSNPFKNMSNPFSGMGKGISNSWGKLMDKLNGVKGQNISSPISVTVPSRFTDGSGKVDIKKITAKSTPVSKTISSSNPVVPKKDAPIKLELHFPIDLEDSYLRMMGKMKAKISDVQTSPVVDFKTALNNHTELEDSFMDDIVDDMAGKESTFDSVKVDELTSTTSLPNQHSFETILSKKPQLDAMILTGLKSGMSSDQLGGEIKNILGEQAFKVFMNELG